MPLLVSGWIQANTIGETEGFVMSNYVNGYDTLPLARVALFNSLVDKESFLC